MFPIAHWILITFVDLYQMCIKYVSMYVRLQQAAEKTKVINLAETKCTDITITRNDKTGPGHVSLSTSDLQAE